MIAKLHPNRVRRTYLGGGRINAFCGVSGRAASTMPPYPSHDGGFVETALPEMPRPEDWIASTVQAFNGTAEIDGEGLGRIEDGRLVKDAVGSLPILVKLLDADERLVIQAHPTVLCAKRLFNSSVGKTECWYFLPDTSPDACVYLGFKPGVTREKWEQAVLDFSRKSTRSTCSTWLNNPLLDMLHRIPVAPGDFVFVDGGVPHAIGAGCFMVELQEPSDLMVVAERFTPSGRRIPDAKMHGGVGWDKMFDVYEYEGLDYEEVCRRYVRRGNVKLWNCGNMELWKYENGNPIIQQSHNLTISQSHNSTRLNIAPVTQICGPELTDKFGMWLVLGGGRVALPRDRAVAIVTDGAGSVNGIDVKKGERILVYGEKSVGVQGGVALVVCA